jgi:hypothetical protein
VTGPTGTFGVKLQVQQHGAQEMEISDQTTCLDPYFASFEESLFIQELQT